MTIEEIRKNAPEGATHYKILKGKDKMIYNCDVLYMCFEQGCYHEFDDGIWVGEPMDLPSNAIPL